MGLPNASAQPGVPPMLSQVIHGPMISATRRCVKKYGVISANSASDDRSEGFRPCETRLIIAKGYGRCILKLRASEAHRRDDVNGRGGSRWRGCLMAAPRAVCRGSRETDGWIPHTPRAPTRI